MTDEKIHEIRKIIYDVIKPPYKEKSDKGKFGNYNKAYNLAMLVIIIISLVPLTVKKTNAFITTIDYVVTFIFIVDYLLRFITADFALGKGENSFKAYPFTPMAIVDMLSILPTLGETSSVIGRLRLLRVLRSIRVVRVLKMFRYSKSIEVLGKVVEKEKEALEAVLMLGVSYVLICSLVIFNVEPDTFKDFFEAVYWATVSLTTMGYGDIYPLSTLGRAVTILSAIIGIAIVALPAGIITAGYMHEILKNEQKQAKKKQQTTNK